MSPSSAETGRARPSREASRPYARRRASARPCPSPARISARRPVGLLDRVVERALQDVELREAAAARARRCFRSPDWPRDSRARVRGGGATRRARCRRLRPGGRRPAPSARPLPGRRRSPLRLARASRHPRLGGVEPPGGRASGRRVVPLAHRLPDPRRLDHVPARSSLPGHAAGRRNAVRPVHWLAPVGGHHSHLPEVGQLIVGGSPARAFAGVPSAISSSLRQP